MRSRATFAYFASVDERFSPYKPDSEALAAMNRGELSGSDVSPEMHEVLMLAELTRHETRGVFDIRRPDGRIDPSGLVKGWGQSGNAERRVDALGFANYCIEAGGDIQCRGHAETGAPWRIGIRNPFDDTAIVKVLVPGDRGVATSGDYVRGTAHPGSLLGRRSRRTDREPHCRWSRHLRSRSLCHRRVRHGLQRHLLHRGNLGARGLCHRSQWPCDHDLGLPEYRCIMIAAIERLIDRTTMYRLVFWYLAALIGAALVLGAVHLIAVDPISLLLSVVLVLASGYLVNEIFARIFGAIPNVESVYITGMIIVP